MCLESVILSDLANGAQDREYLKKKYGMYGINIIDSMVTFGQVKYRLYRSGYMVYRELYILPRKGN